ncbi:hypothetical protein F2P81_009595 [Scophthalmus maximus]|uniref:HTH OST-type domain-containing protein n=1 Tax=Scophthalmus maximus TaxID=52904 RepID=A0A6A4T7R5_SCOMX|nr:hypothetical protein F2P81_009595 [Scophthalmus maximus]
MADGELVKKVLRAILQANKGGVSLSRLQSEYKELNGEQIPHKQMGHNHLYTLLASMPSVVRMERNRSGEMVYFASGANETAHVAKVVARQRSSKKTGRPHMVNTQMRVKPAAPLVLNVHTPPFDCDAAEYSQGFGGGCRDVREGGEEERGALEARVNKRQWDGELSPKKEMCSILSRSDKRMTLPSRFHKEVQAHLSRNPPQTGPPLNLNENLSSGKGKPYNPQQVQGRIREILGKYSNGFWVSKLPQIYRELYKQDLPTEAIKDLDTWTHICTVEKTCSSNPTELLLYPAKDPTNTSTPSPILRPNSTTAPVPSSNAPTDKPLPSPAQPRPPTAHLTRSGSHSPPSPPSSSSSPSPPSSPATLSPDLRLKLEELLVKYSNGLWAHALPKLFQDTYKVSNTLKHYHIHVVS